MGWNHQLVVLCSFGPYCWWFRNPANQLRSVVYPIKYKALYTSGGCLGFLPSTDIRHIGSRMTTSNSKSVAENCAGSRDRCQRKVVGHGTTYQSLSAMSWTDQWVAAGSSTVDPSKMDLGWWNFKYFCFMFTPKSWGNDPIWLAHMFKWVGSTTIKMITVWKTAAIAFFDARMLWNICWYLMPYVGLIFFNYLPNSNHLIYAKRAIEYSKFEFGSAQPWDSNRRSFWKIVAPMWVQDQKAKGRNPFKLHLRKVLMDLCWTEVVRAQHVSL